MHSCISRTLHLITLMSIGMIMVLLSACTTAYRNYDCSHLELKNIQRHYAQTSADIRKSKTALTNLRLEMRRENCRLGIYKTNSAAARCLRISNEAEKLQSSIKSLEERQKELKAVTEGRAHNGQHIKGCTPNWPTSTKGKLRKPRTTVKTVALKPKRANVIRSTDTARPVPDIVIGPYEKNNLSSVPSETTANALNMPASITLPAYSKATLEKNSIHLKRNLNTDLSIRKVGSSFFPDQSELTGRPIPVREVDP